MIRVRFLIGDDINYKDKSWDAKGWEDQAKSFTGYADATITQTYGSTANTYIWATDNSLSIDRPPDDDSSESSHDYDGTDLLAKIKSNVKQIVIWSQGSEVLECIDDSVLSGFDSLRSVHFLTKVNYIGDKLFKDKSTLRQVNFYAGVKYFETGCFQNAGTSNTEAEINFFSVDLSKCSYDTSTGHDGKYRFYIQRPNGTGDAHWYDVNFDAGGYNQLYFGSNAFKQCQMKLNFLTCDVSGITDFKDKCASHKLYSNPVGYATIESKTYGLGISSDYAMPSDTTLPSAKTGNFATVFKNSAHRGLLASDNVNVQLGYNSSCSLEVSNYGGGVFKECYSLADTYVAFKINSVSGSSDNNGYKGPHELFEDTDITGLYLSTVATVYTKMCYNCEKLSIVLFNPTKTSNRPTVIGESAFDECSSLVWREPLPDEITTIHKDAFRENYSFEKWPFRLESSNLTSLGSKAFYGVRFAMEQKYVNGTESIELFPRPHDSYRGLTTLGLGAFYDVALITPEGYVISNDDITSMRCICKFYQPLLAVDLTSFNLTSSSLPLGGIFGQYIQELQISENNLAAQEGYYHFDNLQNFKYLTKMTILGVSASGSRGGGEWDHITITQPMPPALTELRFTDSARCWFNLSKTVLKTCGADNEQQTVLFDSWRAFRNTYCYPETTFFSRKADADKTVNTLALLKVKDSDSGTYETITDLNLQSIYGTDYSQFKINGTVLASSNVDKYNIVNPNLFINSANLPLESITLHQDRCFLPTCYDSSADTGALIDFPLSLWTWQVKKIIVNYALEKTIALKDTALAQTGADKLNKVYNSDYLRWIDCANYPLITSSKTLNANTIFSYLDNAGVYIGLILPDNISKWEDNSLRGDYYLYRTQDYDSAISTHTYSPHPFTQLKEITKNAFGESSITSATSQLLQEIGSITGTTNWYSLGNIYTLKNAKLNTITTRDCTLLLRADILNSTQMTEKKLDFTDIFPNLQTIRNQGILYDYCNLPKLNFKMDWCGCSKLINTASPQAQFIQPFDIKYGDNNSVIQLQELYITNQTQKLYSSEAYPIFDTISRIDYFTLNTNLGASITGPLTNASTGLSIKQINLINTAPSGLFQYLNKDKKGIIILPLESGVDRDTHNIAFQAAAEDSTGPAITIVANLLDAITAIPSDFTLELSLWTHVFQYDWDKTGVFKDAIDHIIYKGSRATWGVNADLITGASNPIQHTRKLTCDNPHDDSSSLHQIKIDNWSNSDTIYGLNPETANGKVLQKIRKYTYYNDPFLNSLDLKTVNIIGDNALSGTVALREIYNSETVTVELDDGNTLTKNKGPGYIYNNGLSKTIYSKYINTTVFDNQGTKQKKKHTWEREV